MQIIRTCITSLESITVLVTKEIHSMSLISENAAQLCQESIGSTLEIMKTSAWATFGMTKSKGLQERSEHKDTLTVIYIRTKAVSAANRKTMLINLLQESQFMTFVVFSILHL